MEKWVRRSVQAAVAAGVVGVGGVGVAQADDTTVVAPGAVSESVSAAGSNGILVGNSVSAPVVLPVTDNNVAGTLVGAAANAQDVLVSAGLLGSAQGCASGGDDVIDVSPVAESSSASVVGDNHIGSGNSISVPVVAPVTGNDVAAAGIGVAANVDSLTGALGILGEAQAGDCPDGGGDDGYGNGDDGYGNGGQGSYGQSSYEQSGYDEQASGGDTTVVTGGVASSSASQVGDNSILSGNSVSVPVYAPITGNDVSAAGIGAAVNADDVSAALGVVGQAVAGGTGADLMGDVASAAGLPAGETQNATAEVHSAEPEMQDASTSSGDGETTVVAPSVESESASQVGDNSVASGNSVSVPVTAPVTDNDAAAAGVGAAANAEDVSLVGGILGTASALLDN